MSRSLAELLQTGIPREKLRLVNGRYRGWDLTYGFGLGQVLDALLPASAPLVVDAGAYKGKFVANVLALRPDARVHAFEPIPRRAKKLRRAYSNNPGVSVHAVALGQSARTATLHLAGSNPFSSLLPPSRAGIAVHGKRIATCQETLVEVRRLKDVLNECGPQEGRIDLFKLDVQGYEIQALAGAGELLESTSMVLAEAGFEAMYEGQPLFADLDRFMRVNGFALHGLFHLRVRDEPGSAPRHLAGDALYLNTRPPFREKESLNARRV